MRTTIVIPNAVYERAKKLAKKINTTLSNLTVEALEMRIHMQEKEGAAKRAPFKLGAFSMGKERTDVSDRESLYKTMEG